MIAISRAQAEALLTLAESLEACERVGLTMLPEESVMLYGPQTTRPLASWDTPFDGATIRLVVDSLAPKPSGS